MSSPRLQRKHFLATGLAAIAAAFTGRRAVTPSSSTAPAGAPRGPQVAPAARTVARTDLV